MPAHTKVERKYDGAVFNNILQVLGLRAEYEKLPGKAKAYIKNAVSCDAPRLVFGESLQFQTKNDKEVKNYLLEMAFNFYMPIGKWQMPTNVLVTVLTTFYDFVNFLVRYPQKHSDPKVTKSVKVFADKAKIIFDTVAEDISAGFESYFTTMELALLYKSIPTEYFYYIFVTQSTRRLKISLNKKQIEKTYFTFDNSRRKSYPIEFAYADSLRHAKVTKKDTWDEPRLEKHDEWKIYIQDHALRRMDERLKVGDKVLPYYVGWIETFLNPKKVKNKRLIPYYLFKCRLGYFAYEILEDEKVIVLTTFLTPMMNGTPESDALYEKLKLTNQETRYLGLDTIEALLTSDLLKDPATSEIFEECGITRPDFLHNFIKFNVPKLEIAERFKKHICLDNKGVW
jgi:hypothetical protein